MVQALVFAIGAVTRIFMYADHFTARLRRRGHSPLAAAADVRGRRFYLPLAAAADVRGRRFYLPLVVVASVRGKRSYLPLAAAAGVLVRRLPMFADGRDGCP